MHRVFRQFATLALFAAFALGLAACGGKSPTGGKDVAATVNGKEITLADVDRIVTQQLQGQQLSTPDMAAARLQALDTLIQREAVVQKAENEKAVPTEDEITTAINAQRSQVTAEDWQKFMEQNKLTEREAPRGGAQGPRRQEASGETLRPDHRPRAGDHRLLQQEPEPLRQPARRRPLRHRGRPERQRRRLPERREERGRGEGQDRQPLCTAQDRRRLRDRRARQTAKTRASCAAATSASPTRTR